MLSEIERESPLNHKFARLTNELERGSLAGYYITFITAALHSGFRENEDNGVNANEIDALF